MIKPLVGVLIVLASVLGVESFVGQRKALNDARERLAAYEAMREAEPQPILGFALDRGGDKKLATADLCGEEVVLLYLYSDAKRDPAVEKNLAAVAKANPGKVRVVPIRDAESTGAAPKEIAKLGTPVTDTGGALARGYRVETLPTVVVLKGRPVYHAALRGGQAQAEELEATVDLLVARDDLAPSTGGCGGGCGGESGGGGCMASQMIAEGGPAACSH